MSNVISPTDGMRLAKEQPPDAGFSVRHQFADPKLHRLGIMMMRVGTDQLLRDRRTGKKTQLTVRDKTRFPKVTAALVCLHPMCVDKSWKSLDELVADHPTTEAMKEAGERHVVGWYSEQPLEAKDENALDVTKLLLRAKAGVSAAEKALTEAKDDATMATAFERLELAKKNVAGLQKMATEQAAAIVGFLSEER